MSRARRPPLSLPAPETLQVLDMGLDFRSYLSRVDDTGLPVLGNVISYEASRVADIFEPTVGLLVTIVHLFEQGSPAPSQTTWLRAYDTVQKVFLDQAETNSEEAKCAQEARKFVAQYLTNGLPADTRSICERLLVLLDYQSGIRGSQAPSQRKMPRDPKGAFCNLHLADHKCYQEFACNQLHLHEAGPVRHRMNFFRRLAEVLTKENKSHAEIVNRVKDSIFFARYGNKVTVRCHGNYIPFFKTVYTDGRLEQAFRYQQISCNDISCTNEHCRGIHPQDRRLPPSTKPMDLHNPQFIIAELDEEAEYIVETVENARPNEVPHPPVALSPIALSPTTELWRDAVRNYVRQSGIPQIEADESLLRTLQDTKLTGTPMSSCDRMTPLLEEIDTYALNSSISSTNSDSKH